MPEAIGQLSRLQKSGTVGAVCLPARTQAKRRSRQSCRRRIPLLFARPESGRRHPGKSAGSRRRVRRRHPLYSRPVEAERQGLGRLLCRERLTARQPRPSPPPRSERQSALKWLPGSARFRKCKPRISNSMFSGETSSARPQLPRTLEKQNSLQMNQVFCLRASMIDRPCFSRMRSRFTQPMLLPRGLATPIPCRSEARPR